jgi:transcriptional regulator with XRE-family HTH domain
MISATQSKMARAALGWTIRDTATRAGLGVATIARFEAGMSQPTRANLELMRRTYEAAGIAFAGGEGVHVNGKAESEG